MLEKFSFLYHKILTFSDQKYFQFMLVLILIGTILETTSVGMVFPVLNTLFSDNPSIFITIFGNFLNLSDSQSKLILISLSALLIIFTFKSIFLSVLKYKENKYIADLKVKISNRFYRTYINKPFLFHQKTNSYILKRNLLNVNEISDLMRSFLVLISESLVFITLIILLFFIEPLGSILSIFVFGSIGLLFQRKIGKYAKAWGEKRNLHEGLKIKEMQLI